MERKDWERSRPPADTPSRRTRKAALFMVCPESQWKKDMRTGSCHSPKWLRICRLTWVGSRHWRRAMLEVEKVKSVMKSPLTCLIVDDSAFMRFHLRRMMDSFDNVIDSEAANGNEAIREYGRLKPDIVLMDIVMPGLEGVETVKRICDQDPKAKVIMISSVSYQEKVAEAMSAGAKWFIPKPVTTAELRRAIENVLSPTTDN